MAPRPRAALAAVAVLACCAASGCAAPRGARVQSSPQRRGDRFANPPAWPQRIGVRGVLRWRLTPGVRPRPAGYRPPTVENDGARLRANRERASITWIGHATTLLQLGGANVLTDPIFSNDISGFFRRTTRPGVEGWLLPPIDVVIVSHNHRDHLDEPSVLALGPRPTYVVPLGLGRWFRARGLPNVIELDWWEQVTLMGGRLRVTLVPAQHWSQRSAGDHNESLWGGYVLEAGARKLYFAGDTGYPAAFVEIGRRFPGLDVALLPIGAYAPRWFMHPQHMSPEEAARALRELGARRLVPIHWGTFHLTDEPMDEPPALLRAALGGEPERILQLAIGDSWFEP